MFLIFLGTFKDNMIFGSNEVVIYLVLLCFLMILTKNMNQLDFNEDMRSLDDKKVFQGSQFEDLTSRTGVDLVMIIPFNYTPDLCVVTVILLIDKYKVGFSKVFFAKISLGMTYIVLRSNTFEKNSERRSFS